jgi:hypothetical protein
MNTRSSARLRELLNFVATPGSPQPPRASTLSTEDGRKLVQDGNAVRVADPSDSTGWCIPFSVIEEKSSGDRRRFILWPREQNAAAYAAGFDPDVNLEHVSAYLDAAQYSCGVTRDLEVGFWQVPIPQAARRALRFMDKDGAVYEPTRLPMGHCAAVDIMQLVTSVIANDPTVVKPQFAVRGTPHVWVDGIRFAGSQENVERWIAAADATAAAVNATWKETPPISKRYDFIGVDWDHEQHTVVTLDKTLAKIAVRPEVTALELEQLLGRLLFASGVSRTPLAPFYYAIKWTKRVTNKINRGELSIHTKVGIPAGTLAQFKRWAASVRRPLHIVASARLQGDFTLFTDASDFGWGAVLFNDGTAEISVAGAKWSATEKKEDISERELRAVTLATDHFRPKLQNAASVKLRIDNTSVLSCVVRGVPRAERLARKAAEMTQSLKLLHGAVTAQYIQSDANPADEPSRGAEVKTDKLGSGGGSSVNNNNNNNNSNNKSLQQGTEFSRFDTRAGARK